MIIAPSAVKEFLERPLRDSREWKQLTDEELDRRLAALDPPPRFRTPPFGRHQKVAFLLGILYPRYLELLDMGLGKSWVALNLFAYAWRNAIRAGEDPPRMLVLVPGAHNVREWTKEAARHAPKNVRVNSVDAIGYDARMLQVEDEAADVVVMTYAGFLALVCKGKQHKDGSTKGWTIDRAKLRRLSKRFRFFVGDEATAWCNPESLTHRACRALSWAADWSYGMTGTPFGVDPTDLWGLFYVVDKGETLGETQGLFRAALCKEVYNHFSSWPTFKLDERKKSVLRRMIRHNSIRYHITEATDLKEPVRTVVPVEWDEATWSWYDKVVEEMSHARRSFKLVDSAFTRLRNLTAGYLSCKSPTGERVEVEFPRNPKLDAVVDDLLRVPLGHKAVVFHWHQHAGDLICQRLKKEKIRHRRLAGGQGKKAGDRVAEFLQDPKVDVLVSSSAGAYGGNWQAATYVFFFESPCDPKLREQMERRVWRMGQERQVVYRDYLVVGSVDEKIHKALAAGRNLLEDIVEGRVDLAEFARPKRV